MPKIFFTSDNHFSHKNIHKFCPKTRPHSDWNEMDEAMIRQWQSQVRPEDTVYMLGDVFFCNAEKAISIMQRLPGHKNLVYGNHDNAIRSNSTLRGMFEYVAEYREVSVNGCDIVMFHYPIQEWNKMHRGSIHLYGHIHGALSGVGGRTVNVCVDSPEMSNPNVPYSLYTAEDVIAHAMKQEIHRHHDMVIL